MPTMIAPQRPASCILILFLVPTALAISAFANSYVPNFDDNYYVIGTDAAKADKFASKGEYSSVGDLPKVVIRSSQSSLRPLPSLAGPTPTREQAPIPSGAFNLEFSKASFTSLSVQPAIPRTDATIQRQFGDSYFFAPGAHSNSNSGKPSSVPDVVKEGPTLVGAIEGVALNPTPAMSITLIAPPDAGLVNFTKIGSPLLPGAVAVSDDSPSTAVLTCYVLLGFALVGRRFFTLRLR